MIELYWKPDTVADVTLMALRLVAAEHRVVTVGVDVTPTQYLRVNPAGTVPTLLDDELVLFESIAILMYLADQYPEVRLAPPPGTYAHALYDRWLAYISAQLMGAFYRWYKADEMIDGAEHQDALKRAAIREINTISRRIEAELGDRDWLLGEGPTMPDLLLGNVATWGNEIDGAGPAGPRLAGLVARVAAL